MKIKLILFLVVSVAFTNYTNACTCIEEHISLDKKVTKAFEESELVIIGKVIEIKEYQSYPPKTYTGDPIAYTFEIEKIFKGVKTASTVTIISSRDGASCGYRFNKGESYLVFSSLSGYFARQTGEDSIFTTSICKRNQVSTLVRRKELKMLEKLSFRK